MTFCGAIESRCSFIININDSLLTGSCTEWYLRCKVKPGMDGFLLLAPTEDQIQRMFFLPVCSSSMCILNVIEQSGKVMYSYFIHVLVRACTLKAYLAPLQ